MLECEIGQCMAGVPLEPPCLYVLPSLDDDAFRHDAAFATLLDMFNPCRTAVLGFNQEADACNSLGELAALYVQHILEDVEVQKAQYDWPVRIVLVGYGFGACLGHQMALQLEDMGRELALIVLDTEVSSWFPKAPTFGRLGGYAWLGGEVEAALLMCRAFGAVEYARRAAAMRAKEAEEDGGLFGSSQEDALMEAFWEAAQASDVSQQQFVKYVLDCGYTLDRWRNLCLAYEPPDSPFQGEALLIRAADGGGDAAGVAAGEFRGAAADCAKYCSKLEVADVPGNHYNLCQPTEAGPRIDMPQAVAEFLILRGYFGELARERVSAARQAKGDGVAKAQRIACGGVMELID